jgi:hypothetical protein
MEQREEQLKAWLMEVRIERRRLEDRILQGSASASQDVRAELEAALLNLSAAKASAEAELASMDALGADRVRVQVLDLVTSCLMPMLCEPRFWCLNTLQVLT